MIRIKLALLFSLLTGLALLLFMSLVYLISDHFNNENFYKDLFAQVELEAQVMLEKDELRADIYAELFEQHLARLPEEEIFLIELSQLDSAVTVGFLSESEAAEVIDYRTVSFEREFHQWVGIFYEDNEGDFVVLISGRDVGSEQEQAELLSSMLIGLVITMVIQFLIGYFFARTIVYPLIAIGKQAERISAMELSSRFQVKSKKDELGLVASRLNEMLDRLESGFKAQREFISNASHELKTPLTVILGQSDYALEKERSGEEYQYYLSAIRTQSEKLTITLADLIQLTEVTSGGSQYLDKKQFRIEDLILEIHAQMDSSRSGRIQVEYGHPPESGDELLVTGNYRLLRIAISNLVGNALKFSEEIVTIKTEYCGFSLIRIEVIDHGIGIPKDEILEIKNPFYRAKNALEKVGSGIGLSIVDQIINLHQGSFEILSEEGLGTTMRVELSI